MDKIVRVETTDGRIIIGLLVSVDKTKAVLLQDALELIVREGDDYFEHALYTPYIL